MCIYTTNIAEKIHPDTIWTNTTLGFFCEMTSQPPSWKYDVISEIQLCQSMHIHLKNNPAKFHPDPTENHGTLGFLGRGRPNKKNKNKMTGDRRSVPDLKIYTLCAKNNAFSVISSS